MINMMAMRAKSLNDVHIQSSLMMKFNREHSGVLSRNYADIIIRATRMARLARGLSRFDQDRDVKKTGIQI